ncbi:MBL fold metallo-hydrolase [Sphingomonas sp. SORGH_AS_0879]|uniref:MBL fold metallo-hydrolase n=1 Tax=Sphingomonas sp. SORGH_AS_0879 TaxID=3041790 RepID=UPI0027824800|nr:MBL fold metallo-hydrolase [Sphingomonas sp. SORGH_AS_0879]MDQ1229169.1 glyoxylase-like metal-dependent hydrolase (beta-lactamase superfamily II) [Sphingomonas sp. SORGH_AS_0879]
MPARRMIIAAALVALATTRPAATAPGPVPPPLRPQQVATGATKPVGGQAPGYYRLFVGRFEVTALLDGTHPFPSDRVAIGATRAEVEKALGEAFLPLRYEGMINAFLIDMDGRLVLIDSGAGNLYGTEGGGLKQAIVAAGYTPEQVTDVFVTHLHEDHVGGLVLDGQPVFPHATIHIPRKDADFWLDDRNRAGVDDLLKPFFPAVQGVLAPYRRAGRVSPFEEGAALLPGLTPIAAPGHTPGHTAYLLSDAGQSLLFWGDTVHMAPVQLPHPKVAIRYDWNVPMAVASRRTLFAMAADRHWLVAGAHISFPGIGHVRHDRGGGYAFVPTNYTLNRGRP